MYAYETHAQRCIAYTLMNEVLEKTCSDKGTTCKLIMKDELDSHGFEYTNHNQSCLEENHLMQ